MGAQRCFWRRLALTVGGYCLALLMTCWPTTHIQTCILWTSALVVCHCCYHHPCLFSIPGIKRIRKIIGKRCLVTVAYAISFEYAHREGTTAESPRRPRSNLKLGAWMPMHHV